MPESTELARLKAEAEQAHTEMMRWQEQVNRFNLEIEAQKNHPPEALNRLAQYQAELLQATALAQAAAKAAWELELAQASSSATLTLKPKGLEPDPVSGPVPTLAHLKLKEGPGVVGMVPGSKTSSPVPSISSSAGAPHLTVTVDKTPHLSVSADVLSPLPAPPPSAVPSAPPLESEVPAPKAEDKGKDKSEDKEDTKDGHTNSDKPGGYYLKTEKVDYGNGLATAIEFFVKFLQGLRGFPINIKKNWDNYNSSRKINALGREDLNKDFDLAKEKENLKSIEKEMTDLTAKGEKLKNSIKDLTAAKLKVKGLEDPMSLEYKKAEKEIKDLSLQLAAKEEELQNNQKEINEKTADLDKKKLEVAAVEAVNYAQNNTRFQRGYDEARQAGKSPISAAWNSFSDLFLRGYAQARAEEHSWLSAIGSGFERGFNDPTVGRWGVVKARERNLDYAQDQLRAFEGKMADLENNQKEAQEQVSTLQESLKLKQEELLKYKGGLGAHPTTTEDENLKKLQEQTDSLNQKLSEAKVETEKVSKEISEKSADIKKQQAMVIAAEKMIKTHQAMAEAQQIENDGRMASSVFSSNDERERDKKNRFEAAGKNAAAGKQSQIQAFVAAREEFKKLLVTPASVIANPPKAPAPMTPAYTAAAAAVTAPAPAAVPAPVIPSISGAAPIDPPAVPPARPKSG